MTDVVQKLWGFCHTLRHDGIDYGDYIEQITYLLFLKMADERGVELPKGCDWPNLREKTGTELSEYYVDLLRKLGKAPGVLGDIYSGAQSRFSNPVNLKRLINLVDETEWTELGVDVKAEAYEGLLEKAASEGKKGAGQYFTPRILIQSIVRCVKPDPRAHREFTICDPACGTGGFLVAAYEWFIKQTKGGAMDRNLAKRIKHGTYFGQDLVARPRRLALMNLFLHGLEPEIAVGDSIYEVPSGQRYDVVLTNPPFGTKGANQAPEREDFTIATSNKQLNFLQHVMTILKRGGRAAVVVPDNCLFADQAGEVFEILTQDCDLHTVLRLPRGTFTPYSAGTKTNVVFFTRGYPTENTWIYDGRSNVPGITKKDRPLTPEHFAEFEKCFGLDPNGRAKRSPSDSKDGRWRAFHISDIKERGFKLDSLKWLRDESLDDADELPEPEELVADAIVELERAVEELSRLTEFLAIPEVNLRSVSDALPEGWSLARLDEIANVSLGKMLDRAKRIRGRRLPYLRNLNVRWDGFELEDMLEMPFEGHETEKFAVRAGDLLICEGGEPGRAAVWRGGLPEVKFQKAILRARMKGDVEPRWVMYALRHSALTGDLERYFTGSTIKHFPLIAAKSFELPLAPLSEQRRIVNKIVALLSQATSAREHLEEVGRALGVRLVKAPGNPDRLTQSILAKAFTGHLVTTESELARREGHGYETAFELLGRIKAGGACSAAELLQSAGR